MAFRRYRSRAYRRRSSLRRRRYYRRRRFFRTVKGLNAQLKVKPEKFALPTF